MSPWIVTPLPLDAVEPEPEEPLPESEEPPPAPDLLQPAAASTTTAASPTAPHRSRRPPTGLTARPAAVRSPDRTPCMVHFPSRKSLAACER